MEHFINTYTSGFWPWLGMTIGIWTATMGLGIGVGTIMGVLRG